MKLLLSTAFLVMSLWMQSQSLSKQEHRLLRKLQVNVESLDMGNEYIISDLQYIVSKDRKRKSNRAVAFVFTSIAAAGILSGVVATNQKGLKADVVGSLLIGTGVFSGAISIPFWISSTHRKKERDRKIKLFN